MENIFEIYYGFIVLSSDQSKILLCKNEEENFYFLPIQRAKKGLSLEKSIDNYFREKFSQKINYLSYLGILENMYDGHHQYVLVFKIGCDFKEFFVPENGFIFEWIDVSFLRELDFQPNILKKDLLHWLDGEMVFLTTNAKIYFS
jgi:hypothetical protein